MPSDRSTLERQIERVELRPFTLEGFHRRRSRKQRNQRIVAAVVVLALAAAGIGALARMFSSNTIPASDPRSPFLGSWFSTDIDGSAQTMEVRAPEGEALEIVVHDEFASVCSGAPSTMRGTGRLEGSSELVIPSPALTCDDGSEPKVEDGLPVEEQLRNLTFVHDPEADALTDSLGVIWNRVGQEDPSHEARSGGMWPQSNLTEVKAAQRLADAGDPRYTWQLDPELAAQGNPDEAEIFARFLRTELGWTKFIYNPFGVDGLSYEAGEGTYGGVVFIRCAPGRTNPLYPDAPEECAPTIDEFRYETVQFDAAQLGRRGPSGIWVVTSWRMVAPFRQMTPPSDVEAEAHIRAFLGARVAGEGAEEYISALGGEEIPLLYATTTGAPYERFEIERLDGPKWPEGEIQFKVRLFAEGGKTVVEQLLFMERRLTGRLGLEYYAEAPGPKGSITATTENGQALAEKYNLLDGEVTFSAAPPWGRSLFSPAQGLILDDVYEERVDVVPDPLPVGTGCQEEPAPADAAALARSIRSDPDLEAAAPVPVEVGGIKALRMDVVVAPGASICADIPETLVASEIGLNQGERMRLYLLDLPGGSERILAISIVAPDPRFEKVVKAAAPILDSFRFGRG